MKRLTVAAIIAVMAAGVFTGCGNSGMTQQNGGNGTAAAGQTDNADSRALRR